MRAHSVWPAAFGLFVAWLTYSLAPLWPVLGGLPGSASFYASARIFYYAALFLATLVLAILWNRPCDRSGTLFKSLMLATVFGQLVTGILGHATSDPDEPYNVWIACSFVLSGAMTPILQIAWAHAVPRAWNAISGKDVLCASGTCVAALLLLCFSTPLNDLLYSLIPLGSLCLLSPSRRWLDPESESAPDPAPKQSVGAPFALLGGIACALAGSHVFNGAAEIGPSLQQPPIFVGIFTALALFALLQRLSPNHRADVTATATASVLAILLSIAIQGLTSETTGATSSVAAQILHAIVLTCEYLIYLLGLALALERTPKETPTSWRRFSLPIVNGGVAIGAVSGILVTANILTYTVLSLIFSAAALLLLGISWGIRYAHFHAEPRDTRGERLSSFEQAHGLSEREREVFRLWVSGHQLDYIADALCISKNTVKTHVAHIYKKTETANREELIQLVERR